MDLSDSPSDSDEHLSIVPHAVAEEIGSHSRFELPDEGWIVEKVPRRRGSYVDKYYIEEGSGNKFRSLKEVERYIKSGEYPSKYKLKSRKHPSKSRLKSIKYPSRSTEIVCFKRPSPRHAKRYIKRGGKVIRLDEEAYHQKQPSIVKSIGKTRLPFAKLPDGWVIEVVPRRLGGSDKYYIEEGSGNKFRSLKEVERYIKRGEYPSKYRLKSRKYPSKSRLKSIKYPSKSTEIVCFKRPSPRHAKRYIIRGGKAIRLDEEAYHKKQPSIVKSIGKARLPFTDLPDGWVIEVVPRRSGGSDKYYYEPGTGLGFRSFAAVSRHLEDKIPLSVYIEEIKENIPLSKAFKYKRKNESRKRDLTSSEDDVQTLPFGIPPKKMKWVLGSNGGDVWYPFIFETPVPDSMKQQWNERFVNMMKLDGNQHSSSEIL